MSRVAGGIAGMNPLGEHHIMRRNSKSALKIPSDVTENSCTI
jgi:hypothetical protein